jgi:hypothetical protein
MFNSFTFILPPYAFILVLYPVHPVHPCLNLSYFGVFFET